MRPALERATRFRGGGQTKTIGSWKWQSCWAVFTMAVLERLQSINESPTAACVVPVIANLNGT